MARHLGVPAFLNRVLGVGHDAVVTIFGDEVLLALEAVAELGV